MKGSVDYNFYIEFSEKEIRILSSIISNIPPDMLQSKKEVNLFKRDYFNLLKEISDDNDLPLGLIN